MGGTGGEGEGVSRDAGGRSWELAKQLVHLNTEPPMCVCVCVWVCGCVCVDVRYSGDMS